MTAADGRAVPRPLLLALAVWLGLAIALGASGRPAALRPPVPQLMVMVLTVAAALAVARVPTLRSWAMQVDLRALVALHLTRFVGLYFLLLARRGELAPAFAVPAGWGDIVVATLAIAVLAGGPAPEVTRRRALLCWNLLGLADILFVVITAARVAMADPASMSALLRLPLSVIPTFLVPLIIVSHLVIGVRLLRRPADVSTPIV